MVNQRRLDMQACITPGLLDHPPGLAQHRSPASRKGGGHAASVELAVETQA